MLRTFLAPLMILVVFVLIRSGDLAISAALARQTIRCALYALPAIFALIVVVLTLFGIGA